MDTLAVVEAVSMFGCVALQCMLDTAGCAGGLRAHRALDDAIALRGVVKFMAESLGVSTPNLLRRFVCEIDMPTSVAQLYSVL